MKKALLAVVLVFVSLPLLAEWFEPFSRQDYVLQGVFTAVTVVDWMQTKSFIEDGENEANPFLGSHPSQSKIDTYVFAGILSHALISYALPITYRTAWQSSFICIELDAVNHNHSVGVKIKF